MIFNDVITKEMYNKSVESGEALDLRGADLINADLSGANLHRADLRSAGLVKVNLRGSDLREADFGGADLRFVDLGGTGVLIATLGQHRAIYDGGDIIAIGCMRKPIEWWLENYEVAGKKNSYTAEEISDYGWFIKRCAEKAQARKG
jgi:hypothetical protein